MIRPDPKTMRVPDDPDRVVPPSGLTALLTAFVSAAMAFLAVFALLFLFATDRMADRWVNALSETATVRISAPRDQLAEQTAATLTILRQTPGVGSARPFSDEEQADLLAPWFGGDLPLADLPIPRLIEVTETGDGFDFEGLRLRLGAEVPGAVLDDHGRWRRPLISAAERIRLVGWIALGLITVSLAGMVTLAANASLAANSGVISVLRLVGARDAYVARAFTRRFTLRAVVGALAGTVAALLAAVLIPGAQPGTMLPSMRFSGLEWAAPIAIPLVAGAVAFLATRSAALRRLRDMR